MTWIYRLNRNLCAARINSSVSDIRVAVDIRTMSICCRTIDPSCLSPTAHYALFVLFKHHWAACLRKQKERSPLSTLCLLPTTPHSLHQNRRFTLFHYLNSYQNASRPHRSFGDHAHLWQEDPRRPQCDQLFTDFMFEEALRIPPVANWPTTQTQKPPSITDLPRDRPLLAFEYALTTRPDTANIAGHDTTVGYSRNIGHPARTSSAIVRLLQDAGALVHAKTTVHRLLNLETASDIFGVTSNPYRNTHTPGASTGGGAALVACGAARSRLAPISRGASGSGPLLRNMESEGERRQVSVAGLRFVLAGHRRRALVHAPMAGSSTDLEEFWKRVVMAKPWQYDHSCVQSPGDQRPSGGREETEVGYCDGRRTLPPSPACKRALSMVANALRAQGHEVVDFTPPDIFSGLKIAYQLIFSDGGEQLRSDYSPHENVPKVTASVLDLLALPRLFKRLVAYLTRKSDPTSAEIVKVMHAKSALEVLRLTAQREEYRAAWHDKWTESGLDFVLTVPHPFPAFKHGESEKVNLMTAGFTTIFSLLDYLLACFQ
ncbi:putative amidase [Lyophyllum shimeji]|uniref:Amidase n=1 Tax=Lyophyllum shimeji TaxID=47721 RepID=A0A9P3PP58_LYOSH|nr:putative amidase [Lyophyllum shimeji]